ncbi:hypothetical protein VNO77_24286 [Canavalia gladiata]|uniref:Epidermal patterning factor-like protein n=1 Tax=Canavalia gladiata TaxID=3824 RepID=A0AAN9L604_CANGL
MVPPPVRIRIITNPKSGVRPHEPRDIHSFISLSPKAPTSHILLIIFFIRLMDLPKIYLNGLKTSVTLILIISLTLFPSNSEGSPSMKDGKDLKQKKLVLGSRPPRCVNKCLSCKPCMATLVISPHHRVGHIQNATAQRDEGYYLLSWKCKCGNKFYQP